MTVYLDKLRSTIAGLRGELDKALEFAERMRTEREELRAQMAEANRLLTKIRDTEIHESRLLWGSINNHLSASAEPSAPKFKACGRCLDQYSCSLEGCQLGASGKPSAPTPMPAYMEAACDKFDWTLEEALRFYAEGKHFDTDNGRTRILCTGAIASYALKGMGGEYADMKGAEPSAPVEIDERAAFDSWYAGTQGTLGHGEEYRKSMLAWMARAALERKP